MPKVQINYSLGVEDLMLYVDVAYSRQSRVTVYYGAAI